MKCLTGLSALFVEGILVRFFKIRARNGDSFASDSLTECSQEKPIEE